MCERISWIEVGGRLLYLTTYDLFDTPAGKEVREHFCREDWWGHAAIKRFYQQGLVAEFGVERECSDFSLPTNFPPEIAAAIADGKFRDVLDSRLLTAKAYNRWLAGSSVRIAWKEAKGAEDAWARAEGAWLKAKAARTKAEDAWARAAGAWLRAKAAWVGAGAALTRADAARVRAEGAWLKAKGAWAGAEAARKRAGAVRVRAEVVRSGLTEEDEMAFWRLFAIKSNHAKSWR